jgi:hypothetical protein
MIPHRLLLAAFLLCALGAARADIAWIDAAEDGSARVHLYFFWSERCPHCLEALPFVRSLERENPWIRLHSHELTRDRDNVALYVDMAAGLGEEARSVPAFIVCGRMLTGFDTEAGTGREILDLARLCQAMGPAHDPPAEAAAGDATAAEPLPQMSQAIRVPVLGEVAPDTFSLPLFTLVIAGLDAFNPCAFFVLLFLLSLLVHARSRPRMLLVGGTFVFFSGLVYFLFMAAWLNLFLVVGGAPMVTLTAGLVAVLIGVLNVKDWFWFKQGPSLAIPETAKPGLFRRMRGLITVDSMPAMLLGTVALALAANSYELLCTAGFPMVYTRVLTLSELRSIEYYGYLVLYNLVYVLPLSAIVAVFTWTLGARRLSERQGRQLKLLSGVMMLGLGLVLLLSPGLLDRLWVGAALLGGALAVTYGLSLHERRVARGRSKA